MSFRRHTRVRRRSRYEDWFLDVFGGDLRVYAPLDDASGSLIARDASSQSRDGTYSGAIATQQGSIVGGVTGCISGASSSYVDFGDLAAWDFGADESFTFGVWSENENDDSVAQRANALLDTRGTGGGSGVILDLNRSSDGAMRAVVVDDNGDFDTPSIGGDVAGKFRCFSVDKGQNELNLYGDGDVFTYGLSATSSITASSFLSVGARADAGGVDSENTERMQHAFILDRLISQDEVRAIHQQGAKFFDRGRLL